MDVTRYLASISNGSAVSLGVNNIAPVCERCYLVKGLPEGSGSNSGRAHRKGLLDHARMVWSEKTLKGGTSLSKGYEQLSFLSE